jgi:hypothetical protein
VIICTLLKSFITRSGLALPNSICCLTTSGSKTSKDSLVSCRRISGLFQRQGRRAVHTTTQCFIWINGLMIHSSIQSTNSIAACSVSSNNITDGYFKSIKNKHQDIHDIFIFRPLCQHIQKREFSNAWTTIPLKYVGRNQFLPLIRSRTWVTFRYNEQR